MRQAKKYSPEVRERAVRLVFEHEREYPSQWATNQSIAEKIGCSGETLRSWVRQAERDLGKRPGPTTAERERIKGGRSGSSAKPMRSCGRLRLFSHRRSSTAD